MQSLWEQQQQQQQQHGSCIGLDNVAQDFASKASSRFFRRRPAAVLAVAGASAEGSCNCNLTTRRDLMQMMTFSGICVEVLA